ncbi:ABC transporter ATP-binding protein [Pseudoclavibacter sp. RFBB5]|uniref:ABC transporter ATP-binding protein n=1 Tax=Pseudoclavibacter sp. RFBB5 TaxID=2080574 RepID=UPI000CE7CE37|nr:ABC transporter ATP-binding protein [Pseudoclavibacter sp. RFBB5]PPG32288.1 multidrug ABC transporter ATP-binding protein [Pseudoclavibacter sp. RFBB5]
MSANDDVASREAAVVVSALHVRRGGKAVFDGLELSIPRGQITGLLGPSGCGKTTLMRAIVGVQKTAGGTVTVLGEPAGSRQLRSRVSYATQAASVYDDLTVAQNLSYFASVLGSRRADLGALIDRVGLTGQARQKVESLSGGQKNRVSLAVAMLGDPEVLVLDEPTVGLDPVLRQDLWALFRSLADDGATLFVSSHVMDEAMRCDRLILMRDGHLIADTTPPELLRETGTSDADAAFLALIERGDTSHGRHAGSEEGAAS